MSDAFLVFLNRKAYEKFSMTPEERDLYDRAGLDTLQYGADPVPAEESAKKKDETKPIVVEIHIEDRIVRLTPNSSDLADAYVDADGKNLYYLSAFEGGYNLWQTDLRKGTSRAVPICAPLPREIRSSSYPRAEYSALRPPQRSLSPSTTVRGWS